MREQSRIPLEVGRSDHIEPRLLLTDVLELLVEVSDGLFGVEGSSCLVELLGL